ncbi:MAG: cobalt-precorrin-5B (C(1))-methyltransferase [Actinomycetota bacterium]|nr:cobalt-precorrin-5B (C(1))-methyltransferase [Actinomycetota bacterium]
MSDDDTFEPELAAEVAAPSGLRTGWTTGTCAAAATKAAVTWLVTGAAPATVEVALPRGDRVSFEVTDVDPSVAHRCAVVKDAGDDPDCTDRARVTATVRWAEAADGPDRVTLEAGDGVGVVTRPGLGLPVGAPSVTAVPRRMIGAAVGEITDRPVHVVLSVPGGQAMAARTSNERLGIVGGISVLGTTGIVRPYSTAAFRASVVQQINVAAAQGERVVVLSTGSRTDAWALGAWPDLAPVCFVEVGDFTGIALRRAATVGITEVRFVGMVGKITKLAAGVMMTHFRRTKVDNELMAEVAAATGAPAEVVAAARETATARHFFEECQAHQAWAPLVELCRRAARKCAAHAGGTVAVEVVMVDFAGSAAVAHG